MKAVCNTSPLVFFSKLNALELLPQCFSQIYVPDAVVSETRGLSLPSTFQRQTLSVQGMGFVQGALGNLHQGELEAMQLAIETQADYVLLDDLSARRRAARMGLQVMGTVGILLLAHQKFLISSQTARVYLDTLIQQHNLYLSPTVRAEFITALQEQSDS